MHALGKGPRRSAVAAFLDLKQIPGECRQLEGQQAQARRQPSCASCRYSIGKPRLQNLRSSNGQMMGLKANHLKIPHALTVPQILSG